MDIVFAFLGFLFILFLLSAIRAFMYREEKNGSTLTILSSMTFAALCFFYYSQ